MSSSSSSTIARSRSLRKPNPPTDNSSSAVPRSSKSTVAAAAPDADRHGSPSRLPTTKPYTRLASTSSTTTATTKPASSHPLGRTLSSRKQADTSRTESARYPPTTRKASGPLQPTSSTSSSSNSAASTQTRRVASHVRAKSTTSMTGATGLTPATTLRPPSQGNTTNLRAAAHAKPALTDRAITTRTASATSTTTTRSAAAAAGSQAQSRLRPNFSTLQQHYSPAKSRDPKPLTATYLAPPSPSKLPANVAASAETSRLQTELLQLHLLHRDAGAVEAQWRASARDKLGARFEKLRAATEQVAEQEKAGLERVNVLALHSWGGSGGLEEKIQGLDEVFNGVWALSEPGGRYARMVRRFERWMDQVSEVERARRDGTYLDQGEQSIFISDLETPWKEDCAGTWRRLDGWRRQLRAIGELPAGDEGNSSLAKMLRGSRCLVQDMLAEVTMMEEIEDEALAREAEWIEKMNRMEDDDTPQAGAIWRIV